MKKLPLILTCLLSLCLAAVCAVLGFCYQDMTRDYQKIQEEHSSLSGNVANLNTKLEEKDSFILGQKDYISELTGQLAECQGTANSPSGEDDASGENTSDEDASDEDSSSPDSSGYKDLYPDMYAGGSASSDSSQNKAVYLTFDDGPSDLTPQVLDLLDEYNAKATFFVVHTDSETYTSYLKEIVDRGHTLAIHSYSHDYKKIYQSVDAFLDDFDQVYDWVYQATGTRPALFRFPGGSTNGNHSTVNSIIKEMERRGFIYYDWNVSSGDGSNLTTSENILENVCPNVGSFELPVVLMHDGAGKHATLNALPAVLKTLAGEGYEFRSLDETLQPVQYKR